MRNKDGFPTNGVYGFVNMINKIVNDEKPEYMMVAFDIGKTFRHEKYERYKDGRKETPDDLKVQFPIAKKILAAMGIKYLECAGYGVHHISNDGKYLIMGNGTRAFAVAAEQPEKDNPLRTAEMTLEDDYGMIDGVINNGRRGEELEKAQGYAERTTPEKPSIRERLEDAKRECAEHKPQEGKKPGHDVPEHDCL